MLGKTSDIVRYLSSSKVCSFISVFQSEDSTHHIKVVYKTVLKLLFQRRKQNKVKIPTQMQ